MAGVVLDTTVLVDALRGSEAAAEWLAGQVELPCCSEISRVEVIRGLRSAERREVELLFSRIDWVPVTEPVARLAGEFGRTYRRSHQGISPEDLLVAATAELLDTVPATHNVKHFPMFRGLRAPY